MTNREPSLSAVQTAGSHRAAGPSPLKPQGGLLILVFLFLATGIGLTGLYYLRQQQAGDRRAAEEQLAAVADLKASQIFRWRQEIQQHAQWILEASALGTYAKAHFAQPADADALRYLTNWLAAYRMRHDYERILLVDTNLTVRLAAPPDRTALGSLAQANLARALQTNQVLYTDLHLGTLVTNPINMDVFVPLLPRTNGNADTPVGVLMLEINPARFLYPHILAWPTPSRTAETLLVRREGDEVVFLNELRHQTNTALRLRFPLHRTEIPAVRAALGQTGLVEGVDYRGERVLTDLRPIPDSPWFIVTKVDMEEVDEPARQQARMIALVIGALIVAAGLGARVVWRQREAQRLRRELALEHESQTLARRLAAVTRYANDTILLMDEHWHIVEANERAVETYGYALDELRHLTLNDLHVPSARGDFQSQSRPDALAAGVVFESLHQRKDGTTLPVEQSLRALEWESRRFYQAIIRDITERKQAEETAREREARLNAIVNGSPVLQFVIDRNHRVLLWNTALEEYSRIRAVEMVGTNHHWKAFYPEERPCLADLLVNGETDRISQWYGDTWRLSPFVKGGYEAELFISRMGVGGVWLHFTAAPIRDSQGDVFGAVETLEDITERKRAEEALKSKTEELDRFFTVALDLLCIADTDGHFRRLNPQWKTVLGYSLAELEGRRFLDLVHPDDQAATRAAIGELASQKAVLDFVNRYRCKNGSYRWIEWRSHPAGGMIYAAARDITERKQAEDLLRESEEKYKQLVETTHTGYVILDQEGLVADANQEYVRLTGRERLDEILGRGAVEWTAPHDRERNAAEVRRCLAEGWVRNLEVDYVSPTGQVTPVEVNATVIRRADTVRILSLCWDISARKRDEARLRSLNALKEELLKPTPVSAKFASVTEAVITALDADFARIWMVRPADLCGNGCFHASLVEGPHVCRDRSQCLHLVASSGRYTHLNGEKHRRVPLGSYKIGRVATGEDIGFVTNDVQHDSRVHDHAWAKELGLVAFAGYRLTSTEGKPIGVLALFARHALLPEDVTFLEMLAHTSSQLVQTASAEEALRASEARFRATFEQAAVGLAHVAPDGRWLRVNQKLCDILGYNVEELSARTFQAVTFPADLEIDLANVQRMLTGEIQTYSIEKRYCRKDGSIVWANLTVSLLRHPDGTPNHFVSVVEDISARKKTEEALLLKDRALTSSANAVVINALDGRTIYFNEAFLTMYGYTREEASRLTAYDLAYTQEANQRAFAELRARGYFIGEDLAKRKDGSPFPVAISASTILDANGQPLATMGSFLNITERKRGEAALQESLSLLQATLESTADGILVVNHAGQITGYNRRFAELLNVPQELLAAGDDKPVLDVVTRQVKEPEAFLFRVRQLYSEPLAEGSDILELADGRVLERHSRPQFLNGSAVGRAWSFRDITERKRAEEALRRSQVNLHLALDAARMGDWSWDIVTGEVVWSARCKALYGLPPDAIMTYERFLERVHPEDRQRVDAALRRAVEERSDYEVEKRAVWPDGSVHWNATRGRVLCDAAGQPIRVAGVTIDVTERKQAEEALQASLDEKIALLKEVHHRVKNNLQIVISLLNLQAGQKRDRPASETLMDAQNRVRSMALLHETLYRSGNLARIGLASYVEDLCAHLFRSFGTGASAIRLRIQVAGVDLNLDQALPCGLIINELVSNALKHAFPAGRAGQITVALSAEMNRQVTLKVSDDGVGLPTDLSLREAKTLGLQLVHALAEQLGGKAEFGSDPGTTCRVTFRVTDT